MEGVLDVTSPFFDASANPVTSEHARPGPLAADARNGRGICTRACHPLLLSAASSSRRFPARLDPLSFLPPSACRYLRRPCSRTPCPSLTSTGLATSNAIAHSHPLTPSLSLPLPPPSEAVCTALLAMGAPHHHQPYVYSTRLIRAHSHAAAQLDSPYLGAGRPLSMASLGTDVSLFCYLRFGHETKASLFEKWHDALACKVRIKRRRVGACQSHEGLFG